MGSDSFLSQTALNALDGEEAAIRRLFGSPINIADLRNFGYQLQDGVSWRCRWAGCTSKMAFTRGCDLRKHFYRHQKTIYCRHVDCPQSTEGGFSSNKDRDRHESKHNPGVPCEREGCDKIFSRVDNMKDHVKRRHDQGPAPA